jgi:hypothetical protein
VNSTSFALDFVPQRPKSEEEDVADVSQIVSPVIVSSPEIDSTLFAPLLNAASPDNLEGEEAKEDVANVSQTVSSVVVSSPEIDSTLFAPVLNAASPDNLEGEEAKEDAANVSQTVSPVTVSYSEVDSTLFAPDFLPPSPSNEEDAVKGTAVCAPLSDKEEDLPEGTDSAPSYLFLVSPSQGDEEGDVRDGTPVTFNSAPPPPPEHEVLASSDSFDAHPNSPILQVELPKDREDYPQSFIEEISALPEFEDVGLPDFVLPSVDAELTEVYEQTYGKDALISQVIQTLSDPPQPQMCHPLESWKSLEIPKLIVPEIPQTAEELGRMGM